MNRLAFVICKQKSIPSYFFQQNHKLKNLYPEGCCPGQHKAGNECETPQRNRPLKNPHGHTPWIPLSALLFLQEKTQNENVGAPGAPGEVNREKNRERWPAGLSHHHPRTSEAPSHWKRMTRIPLVLKPDVLTTEAALFVLGL